jgi:hypothetical protein
MVDAIMRKLLTSFPYQVTVLPLISFGFFSAATSSVFLRLRLVREISNVRSASNAHLESFTPQFVGIHLRHGWPGDNKEWTGR